MGWKDANALPFTISPTSSKPLRKGKVALCRGTFWNILPGAALAFQHLHRSLALSLGEEVGAGHFVDLSLSGGEHPVCALHVQFPAAV